MTTNTIIHPLWRDDAPALLAFYNGLSRATLHTFRPLRGETTLTICEEIIRDNVAVPRKRYDLGVWDETRLVGWAFLAELGKPQIGLGLGMADAYQRRGLGSALLDALLQWAQEQAIPEIELMVEETNSHAIHLYSSRGFTVYDKAYDEIDELTYFYMRLHLEGELPLRVQEWSPDHPRLWQLQEVTDALHQTKWVQVCYDWHHSSRLLVATKCGKIVGFLRLVTQQIGSDEELPATILHGEPLLEAKVMAFGVVESHRRQGIGRALQEAALGLARKLGCYQLRSYSSGDKTANHQLKLSMGFALHRTVRGEDRKGGYFIMPLQAQFIDAELLAPERYRMTR